MKSDSCTFLKKNHLGRVQLAVMVYVDDLLIAGSAQMLKELMIQEELTLKHVNFLTSENPVECFGRTIKRLKNGNITMEFSQKFIDELLKIFEVTGKVTTSGLESFRLFPKIKRLNVTKSFIRSSGQQWVNFFGWLSPWTTSSRTSRNFQDYSSTS